MKTNLIHIETRMTLKKTLSAIGIAVFSLLLVSACGTKNGTTNATPLTTGTPQSTPTTGGTPIVNLSFLEDSLPGNSLLMANTSTAALTRMSQNLTGTINFTCSEQKSFDYTVTTSDQSQVPILSRQEGRPENPVPINYRGQAGPNNIWGRLSITMTPPSNIPEPSRTFIFQYQVTVLGVVLTSTDQVALFKAINPAPYAADILKVTYTSKNPTIERFRISNLNPFPVSGIPSQATSHRWGSSWLNIVGQKISTTFQNTK